MNSQRVIKADSLRGLGQKVVFDLEDFEKRCDDHLAETRQEVARYLSEAERKAISAQEEAKKQGYEAGYAEGMRVADAEIQKRADAQARQEIDRALEHSFQTMETLSEAIARAKEEWLVRWETEAIRLSITISERILRGELQHRPELSHAMIKGILELVSSEQRLVVRLHPDDARYFQESDSKQGLRPHFRKSAEFRADADLDRGDCIVETDQGQLDGRIATQFEQFLKELVPEEEPNHHA